MNNKNKKLSLLIIFTCAIFIISLFLMEWDFLTEYNFTLQEVCALPVNIGVFLIPVEALVWLFSWMKYRKKGDKSAGSNLKYNISSVLTLVFTIAIFTVFINGRTSYSSFENTEKYSKNDGYYIGTEDKFIKVSKSSYDKITVGKDYSIEYKYNKLIRDWNRIIEIEEDK